MVLTPAEVPNPSPGDCDDDRGRDGNGTHEDGGVRASASDPPNGSDGHDEVLASARGTGPQGLEASTALALDKGAVWALEGMNGREREDTFPEAEKGLRDVGAIG